jgi:hypothetical protein
MAEVKTWQLLAVQYANTMPGTIRQREAKGRSGA